MTIWCSFDVAGRYWVRLKKYKNSKNAKSKCQSSGSEFSIQPTHILANSSNLGTSEVPPLLVHEPASEVCVIIKLAMNFRRRDKVCSNIIDLINKSLFYSNRNFRGLIKGEIKRVVGSTGKLSKNIVNIKISIFYVG